MKSRRFAAVLLVLSMILMLVPVQAFAGEEGSDTISESAVEALSESFAEPDAGEASSSEAFSSVSEAEAYEEQAAEPEEAETAEQEDVLSTSAVSEQVQKAAAAEISEEDVVTVEGEPETVQKDAALEGESDSLTQVMFSGSTSGVTWSEATAAADGDQIVITFNATIASGTSDSELNLNVLNSPNFSTLSIDAAAGSIIRYVVNVSDETGSYAFKADSGAAALVSSSWTESETIGSDAAAAVLLGASASSLSSAANYIAAGSGEGTAFSSILANQWPAAGSSHTLTYYQQVASTTSIADASKLYTAVQFKLTKTDTATVVSTDTEAEETISGSVPLSVKKVLTGQTLKADQFSFELKDADGNVLQTKKNAEDGTVAFDSLEYTSDDIGEHKYTINEVLPEGAKADSNGKVVVDNIEYDTHTESVTITIALNDEGKLKATVRQSTTELTFTNKYNAGAAAGTVSKTSPATGDTTSALPYLGMMMAAVLGFFAANRMRHVKK